MKENMDIDLLVHNVKNSHLLVQSAPLKLESVIALIVRTKQLTAHDRMQGYLLMNKKTAERLRALPEVEMLCKYPCKFPEAEDEEEGTLLGLKIHTHEKISEGLVFAAMVEEKLCIVAVGMGMY